MKSRLIPLSFWIIFGALTGLFHSSGLSALVNPNRSTTRNDEWKPLAREEYVRRNVTYPLYGAGVGLVVGLIQIARRRRRD